MVYRPAIYNHALTDWLNIEHIFFFFSQESWNRVSVQGLKADFFSLSSCRKFVPKCLRVTDIYDTRYFVDLLCVKNKDLSGVWKWIEFNLNKLLWATKGGKRGMKRIMSRKCHPHWAEMILNAFQMSPTWRWDMKKQAEPRLHFILMMGFFFFPRRLCIFLCRL